MVEEKNATNTSGIAATHQVHTAVQLHGLWDVGLPYALPQYVVRLAKLNGYHDTSVHGFIKVVRPVCCHDNETIMPTRVRRRGQKGRERGRDKG